MPKLIRSEEEYELGGEGNRLTIRVDVKDGEWRHVSIQGEGVCAQINAEVLTRVARLMMNEDRRSMFECCPDHGYGHAGRHDGMTVCFECHPEKRPIEQQPLSPDEARTALRLITEKLNGSAS
jgi:hypothetical protein